MNSQNHEILTGGNCDEDKTNHFNVPSFENGNFVWYKILNDEHVFSFLS